MRTEKYILNFKIGIQESMEYRVDFLLNIISVVFVVGMQMFMWKAIYSSESEVLFTYSYMQMLTYTVLANLVSRLTMIDMDVAQTIKSGDLSKYLIKPINYFFTTLTYNVGKRLANSLTVIGIIFGVLLSLYAFFGETIHMFQFILFCLAVFLGFMMNVLIHFMISMTTFWFTNISNLFSTVYIVQLMLSGGIFPLAVFGNLLFNLSKGLPFQYTIQFPVDILTNKLSIDYILRGYIVQVFWICLCSMLAYFMWKRGLKRYMSVGG